MASSPIFAVLLAGCALSALAHSPCDPQIPQKPDEEPCTPVTRAPGLSVAEITGIAVGSVAGAAAIAGGIAGVVAASSRPRYAQFTVSPLAAAVAKGAAVTQASNAGATGYVKSSAAASATTLKVSYTSTCKMGGSSSPITTGCFNNAGSLTVGGVVIGSPSARYAQFTVSPLAAAVAKGAAVTQASNAGATGYVKSSAAASATTLKVSYTSTCKMGGSSSPITTGCFNNAGSLTVGGVVIGSPSALTNKYRTLAGFSTGGDDSGEGIPTGVVRSAGVFQFGKLAYNITTTTTDVVPAVVPVVVPVLVPGGNRLYKAEDKPVLAQTDMAAKVGSSSVLMGVAAFVFFGCAFLAISGFIYARNKTSRSTRTITVQDLEEDIE